MRKRQERQLQVAEMGMLGFFPGVTRKDKIRNEHIRGTLKVDRFGQKKMTGKRRHGRPKRRYLGVVKEDMQSRGRNEGTLNVMENPV